MSDETTSGDDREIEVADVARRAALAASQKRRQARDLVDRPTAADVDAEMMRRLGTSLQRIEAGADEFAGAMVFRGLAAQPLASLLPDAEAAEAKRTLGSVAVMIQNQADLLVGGALGNYRDSVISTDRGAVLVHMIGDVLLVVSAIGDPPDIAPLWQAMLRERAELLQVGAGLFSS